MFIESHCLSLAHFSQELRPCYPHLLALPGLVKLGRFSVVKLGKQGLSQSKELGDNITIHSQKELKEWVESKSEKKESYDHSTSPSTSRWLSFDPIGMDKNLVGREVGWRSTTLGECPWPLKLESFRKARASESERESNTCVFLSLVGWLSIAWKLLYDICFKLLFFFHSKCMYLFIHGGFINSHRSIFARSKLSCFPF